MFNRDSNIAIHQMLNRFESGDPSLLDFAADDIDLRIDHYKDTADTSWQQCKDKTTMISVLTRLGDEVFPKGTKINELTSIGLGDDWYLTTLDQSFWYGLEQQDITSRTYIVSHELNGKVDYFRENVTTLVYATTKDS